ncbi:bifunctional enoyl-CoA hydratase/phosphate acetyltransferase [Halalkalicoccus paucihalophilus]|uniref:Bifunctional enoyl-CoA hydratase/phosphate acetyltransferase n=1 Tax=Halalkalicoccus paucihalophilus TaxID=1008153 RepID=A0A151A8Y2_9EURY|nr:MaoC/PaaZ C-terminal domain-containing protein [Halalkalicoccus paucihalophilus]KYH24156.1 bifunctional enoyl-CoA hydratase/phosphate acetyltransferase [Halalkalicoccus paucihalophilus]
MPVDPVCGMEIPPDAVEPTTEYEGESFYFCSTDCLELFEGAPKKYVETPHPHLVEASGAVLPRLPYGRAKGEFDIDIEDSTSLQEGDGVSFSKVITDDDVRKFAEATSDTNDLHLNDAFAEETRFGHRIVHGTLLSGLISAALACFPGLTIYISQNLGFRRPVDIGESLTARCKIVDELEDERYRLTTRIENDAGEIVLNGTATVLIDPLPE